MGLRGGTKGERGRGGDSANTSTLAEAILLQVIFCRLCCCSNIYCRLCLFSTQTINNKLQVCRLLFIISIECKFQCVVCSDACGYSLENKREGKKGKEKRWGSRWDVPMHFELFRVVRTRYSRDFFLWYVLN